MQQTPLVEYFETIDKARSLARIKEEKQVGKLPALISKTLTSRSWPVLLVAMLCGLTLLSGCSTSGDNLKHSGGTPVNPEADPGGQGMPGSRSTGANPQGTKGRP